MKLARLALLLVCAAAAVVWFQSGAGALQQESSPLEGKPAPDVSLQTLDAKPFKLSELKGNVVVLDFWATWCPPCRKSLPHLQSLHDNAKFKEQGLKVFAVNVQEPANTVKQYLENNKLTFAVPMDEKGATGQKYQVEGIPTTVIVGRDGNVKKVFVGYGGEETDRDMNDAITKALAEKK